MTILDIDSKPKVVKAAELSGADNVLFRRNSVTGAVEARPWDRRGHQPQRRAARQLTRSTVRPCDSAPWSSSSSSRWWPGSAVALWRGSGPLPDPEGCSVTLDGHRVELSTEQSENATLIAAIGVQRGLPARAVSIALATAYQESKIRNLDHGDRDSLGLFQQRPSQGWGTAEQVRDPYYATNAFYDALEKIDGYETMRITEAAQAVQRPGFPEAYEDHATDARALASALTGYSPGGAVQLRGRTSPASAATATG